MVPVATPAAMMVTKSMPRPLASHQPDAVAEHDLAGDEREEDDALAHARHPGRLDLAAGPAERAGAGGGDAGRRRRTVAREADLGAPATAPEDEPDGDRGGQREGEAEMDGQAAEGWDLWGQVGQPRQPGLPGG